MAEWTLSYVKDTLHARAEAQFDFPLLTNPDADFGVIGAQPLSGGAGWFRTVVPADPTATDLEELDPEGQSWDSVDLREIGPIAAPALEHVVGHTREFADQCASEGWEDAAARLRAVATELSPGG